MNGLPKLSDKELEDAFEETMASDALFFLVKVDGEDKGCIIFKRADGHYEMHLCLATWFTHTRTAVKIAISQLDQPVVAMYVASNRAVTRLLDDLGFDEPESFFGYYTDQMWYVRKLSIPVDSYAAN